MAFATKVSVKLSGTDLASKKIRCGSIVLDQPLWGHHTFSVECLSLAADAGDLVGGGSEPLDGLYDALGQPLEIEAAWQGKTAEQGIKFKGIVTEVRHQRLLTGAYSVTLRGASQTILMDGVPRNIRWLQMTTADALKQLASSYGAFCEVSATTTTKHEYVLQHGETDYDFLRRMCQLEGLWAWYDGQKLKVAANLQAGSSKLSMGGEETEAALHRFSVKLRMAPGKFAARGWDAKSHKPLFGETKPPDSASHPYAVKAKDRSQQSFNKLGHLLPSLPPSDLGELDRELQHLREGWLAGLVVGMGESDDLGLDPGTELTISGVSADQKGKYYVTRVRHTLQGDGRGYRNRFTCVPTDIAHPQRTLQRPQQPNVFAGVVTDNRDPEKRGRVKVRYHHLLGDSGDQDSNWARVAMPHAGRSWGMYFLPEVDDEVVVAFVGGDLMQPVVIGSLYNGRGPAEMAPVKAAENDYDKNEAKVLLTKSGHQILFRDTKDEEKIEITTPDKKNRITLVHDKSDPKAKIEIATEGDVNVTAKKKVTVQADEDISIKSKKNISLEAEGELNLKAKGKILIQSNADVEVSGMNTKVGGKMKVEVQGGSEVSVKGAMVKLN
jgi:type VI secretion system secreted protein VgrG